MYEEHDTEKQKILMNKFMTETMVPHMLVLESQLGKNGGVLVGNDVTWADIACYAFFSFVSGKHPDVLNDSPNLAALLAKISSHENIKKYLETRPVTEIWTFPTISLILFAINSVSHIRKFKSY